MRPRGRRLAVCVLTALAVAATPAGALAQEPQTTLPEVEREVMCPVCGTTLELASEAPQAARQRALIRDLIAEGRTKDEIKDVLVAQFGEEVLATPDTKGFDLAAWLVPGVAVVVAAVAILVGLRRWRGAGRRDAAAASGEALDGDEAKRLDTDLARYEL